MKNIITIVMLVTMFVIGFRYGNSQIPVVVTHPIPATPQATLTALPKDKYIVESMKEINAMQKTLDRAYLRLQDALAANKEQQPLLAAK